MTENPLGYGIGGLFRRKLDVVRAVLNLFDYLSSSRTAVSFEDVIPCHFAFSYHVRRLLQRCCSSSAEIETLLDCLYLVSSQFSTIKREAYSSSILPMTASFFGRFSQSGFSHFLQDFQYFALQILARRTSREFLEVPVEMKDLVFCRSV